MSDELEVVVANELACLGFDLVEVRRGGTRARPLIDVRMEHKNGSAVTVQDCAAVSRALQSRLESERVLAEEYELQVSSPGERPLRTVEEWKRFVGSWASVLSPSRGGRFEGRILAVEGGFGEESIVLEVLTKGVKSQRRLPVSEIKEGRLSFHI